VQEPQVDAPQALDVLARVEVGLRRADAAFALAARTGPGSSLPDHAQVGSRGAGSGGCERGVALGSGTDLGAERMGALGAVVVAEDLDGRELLLLPLGLVMIGRRCSGCRSKW
jgi:hypothetical protein